MKSSEKTFDVILQPVCDVLCAMTEEGNYTILQVAHTPNSNQYKVTIFPDTTKPYDDDNTRD